MTDLRSRLSDIERIEPPELWQEIVVREPRSRAGSRGRARVLLAAAVAVAILAAGVLLPLTLLHFGPLARSGGSGHHTMTITYPSESMEPTVHVGQALVIDLDAYLSSLPRRGDVVAFRFEGQLVVKRVIGLPGDIVEERQGQVYVNGVRLDEPYVRPDAKSVALGPWMVPAGHVFVMGDNRPNSNDSRYGMGPIAVQSLVGKVLLGASAPSAPPPPSAPAVSPGLVLPTPGPVTLLLAGEQAFYAVYQTGAPNPAAELLRRDFRTAVVRGADFTSVSDLELAGGWLWVSGQLWMRDQQKPGPMGLFRLDPRTLQIRGTVALPAAGALASSPAGLWVGDGDRLDLVDAAGTIIRVQKADGEVGTLAVDPTGRFLYVATAVSSDDITPRSITERDASTGVVIATVPGPPGVAVTRLSATVDGVWVSISTGLLGQVAFLRAGDLHQTAAFISRGGEAGTNSVHANVGAGVLWVADDMVGSLWCADPATGNLRASIQRPAPADGYGMSDIVTVGSDVYVGTGRGVYRLAPEPQCGASS